MFTHFIKLLSFPIYVHNIYIYIYIYIYISNYNIISIRISIVLYTD